MADRSPLHVALLVTEDWYVVSHRLPVVREAVRRGHRVSVVTSVTSHREEIEAAGAQVHDWRLERSSANPLKELRTLVRLLRILRSDKPDILHCVALKPVLYGSVLARVLRINRTVLALAGLGSAFIGQGVGRVLLRRVLAASLRSPRAWVLVQNPDDASTLHGLGIDPARIEMTEGSGVDLNHFRPAKPPDAPPVVALYAGRLLSDKGLLELHDAAALLRQRGVPVIIRLVGDRDPHNPACLDEAILDLWRAEGLVELLGRRTDVPDLLAGCHFAVLPSYREGSPKFLAEAAAAGRPAIATTVPGCRDVVVDGVTGLLVPARDYASLAMAIERLAANPLERERMGKAARQWAEAHFDQDVIARQTVDLYDRR